MKKAQELYEKLEEGLYAWYPFSKEQSAYLVNGGNLDSFFRKKLSILDHPGESSCDFVILPQGLPQKEDLIPLFRHWKTLLKPTGTFLFPMENPLGLKFFCGDQDPYTGRNFDSISSYRNGTKENGQLISKFQVEQLLLQAGFDHSHFYAVLPTAKQAQLVYAPDVLPEEALSARLFPLYHKPDTLFLEERHLYDSFIANNLFHQTANFYLVEATFTETIPKINQVTLSLDRGNEAMITVMTRDNTVEKRIIHPEQEKKLDQLAENTAYLQERGIPVIQGEKTKDRFIMDYVSGENMIQVLRKCFWEDRGVFLEKMDEMKEIIQKSSLISGENHLGPLLERGFFDLTPVNGLYVKGKPIFFDQEFCVPDLPLNLILWRSIIVVYEESMEEVFPKEILFQRYGMVEIKEELERIQWEFYNSLRNIDVLSGHFAKYQSNPQVIHNNRQRMNYSEKEYQKIFLQVLENEGDKAVYVFGSGKYAKEFVQIYRNDVKISGILDNNKDKWGSTFENFPILDPTSIPEKENAKIIVCVKNYSSILTQLEELSFANYAVFSPSVSYKKPVKKFQSKTEKKTYQRGYVAGVFDLFHIGHLNLLRKAKEQSDYLIVGVVSDEGVEKYKKTKAFISLEERLEIVSACRYVDEAVAIPLDFADSLKAHQLFQFDCQFSGSDYENDANWLKTKDLLEAKGSTIHFLPYTESTSSTQLKKVIEKEGEI